jgi:hypothetical protein
VLRRKKCRTDLIVMAQDYKAKAAAIEVDSKSALSITVIQNILLKTNGNRGRREPRAQFEFLANPSSVPLAGLLASGALE